MNKDQAMREKYKHFDVALLPKSTSTSLYPTSLGSPQFSEMITREFTQLLAEQQITSNYHLQDLSDIKKILDQDLTDEDKIKQAQDFVQDAFIKKYAQEFISSYLFQIKQKLSLVYDKTYYLYHEKGRFFLSFISPEEWDREAVAKAIYTREGKFALLEHSAFFEEEILGYESIWQEEHQQLMKEIHSQTFISDTVFLEKA